MNGEVERMRKEEGVTYFKALLCHVPGRVEETYENFEPLTF